MNRGYWLAVVLWMAGVGAVDAQSSVEEFVAAARRGTVRYRAVAEARADGYRPVGPETPSMGRHWVQPQLLIRGTVDPAKPPILTYATVGGRPVLVGVAYAKILGAGDPDPPPPVAGAAWHTHEGSLRAEAHRVHHRARAGGEPRRERVAVLHAWIWADNPAGYFRPDNWTLPYRRLGLAAPDSLDVDAARALALATGDSAFFATQLVLAAGGSPADSTAIVGVLASAARALSQWWSSRAANAPLNAADAAMLADRWHGLLLEAIGKTSSQAGERLREAFDSHGGLGRLPEHDPR